MERTVSRPPQGGGANWAVFFAPLGVTALVIVGALIFVWTSEPEPVERPEVERVNLAPLEPPEEPPPLSSIPRTEPRGAVPQENEPRPRRRGFSPVGVESEPPASGSAADAEYDDDDYDEDSYVDETSRRQYTPEEREEGKAELREITKKLPFMGPALARAEQRLAERQAGTNAPGQEEAAPNVAPNSEGPATVVPPETEGEQTVGAAGAPSR